jgi:aspartate kinase
MKFGGKSVSSPKSFLKAADIIVKKAEEYKNIVVVVSAMGNATDKLLQLARKVNNNPSFREQDMLVSVGERISIALLAMALAVKGKEAISFTGSQSGIITTSDHSDAKIISVKPDRIISELSKGKIVIVAGFQGVSIDKEITTLGRGGSDTTAVALAIALNAEKVEFYKDVKGFYEDDPKTNVNATFYPSLTYDKAIDIVSKGCKILSKRCIMLAKLNEIPLHIRCYKKMAHEGSLITKSALSEKDSLKKDRKVVYEIL